MERWKVLIKLLKLSVLKQLESIAKTRLIGFWKHCGHITLLGAILQGSPPYYLVYGKSVVFPVEFKINTLRMAMDVNLDVKEVQRSRLNQLNELDEKCIATADQTTLIQL